MKFNLPKLSESKKVGIAFLLFFVIVMEAGKGWNGYVIVSHFKDEIELGTE